MRFFSTLALAASGLASIAAAQATGPLFFTWIVPASVEVGKTYNVSYTAATAGAPVEILLRKGLSTDLKTVATLTSTATGGSYEWTVSTSLPNGSDYALQIKQGSDINYSKQFAITGSTAVASSSASSESSSITSSAASSSSTASASGNSTITTGSLSTATRSGSATGSASTASRSASATTSGPLSAPTNAGSNIKSPLALIFGAVAAMAYLQ